MKRLVLLVLMLVSVAVPAQAATLASSVSAQLAQDGPAVVIDNSEGLPPEVAWTFRFLVPTLMALTLVLVLGLAVWYQRGLSGRYRVRSE